MQHAVMKDTSLARLETNMIVYMNEELEVLQQASGRHLGQEESLVQDYDEEEESVCLHLWVYGRG